jgi:hypothetical protein
LPRYLQKAGLFDAEALAAFGTARANHGTTTASTHPHQKTVSAFAPHYRGLISPFHGFGLSRETVDYTVPPRFCQG